MGTKLSALQSSIALATLATYSTPHVGVSEHEGPMLGVLVKRIIIYWGLHSGP